MREMKDSGVEWIGTIPVHWKTYKLKYIFADGENGLKIGPFGSAMKGKTLETGPYKVYNQAHLIQNDFSLNRHFVSEETYNELKNYEVKPGDVLFSMMGTIGKCQIMPAGFQKGIMDSHLLKTELKEVIKHRFFVYAYDKDYCDQAYAQLNYASNGTIMNGLNSSILKSVRIALPPLEEQDKIIDYLDCKCAAIDNIISKQEQIIEKLKEYKLSLITEAVTKGLDSNVEMKDSGIEKIGKIPQNWSIQKMSMICNVITDYVASGSFASLADNVKYLDEPDYAMLIRTTDVSNKGHETKNIYIDKKAYDFLSNSNLYGGEIILPNIGASVGDAYIVPKLYERMSLAPNSIMIKTKYNDRYYYYYFCSDPGRKSLIELSESAAQPKFNKTELRQLRVPVPDIKEQEKISEELDCKLSIINTQIEQKELIVRKFSEYKKSLIYEVVTGKKEV